jgi:hypothetical protein
MRNTHKFVVHPFMTFLLVLRPVDGGQNRKPLTGAEDLFRLSVILVAE